MSNIKFSRTKDELFSELQAQIQFLQDECKQYDLGNIEYSKKIAVTIRILLHDTRMSVSLLRQIESAFVYNRPDFIDISTTEGDLPNKGHTDFVCSSLCEYDLEHFIDSLPVLIPRAVSINSNNHYHFRSFKTWWERLHVILIDRTNFLSRKDIITLIADTNGGAHVDPNIDERLILLNRNLAKPLKIGVPTGETVKIYTAQTDQILAANVRSIAEEVLYVFQSVLTYCESKLYQSN